MSLPSRKTHPHRRLRDRPRCIALLCALLALGACGGGGGSDPLTSEQPSASPPTECDGSCVTSESFLSRADVERVLAQAIHQASALGVDATIAVVDRVGNVLAVYRMAATSPAVEITSNSPETVRTGLDGVVLPSGTDGDALAAIAKAITGAYLSSEGNAFSTRTASQIIQEHFNPRETDQPAGPLYGVQFSQLPCSDFARRFDALAPSPGPHRSPLGLAADPGGFPLYRNGTPIGGVGVIADGVYSLDRDVQDLDRDIDEQIAYAATFGFEAPITRRADRITVDGKTLRYSDATFGSLQANPSQAPAYAVRQDSGRLIAVTGYAGADIRTGTRFGATASGIVATEGAFAGLGASIFVDNTATPRFPVRDASDEDRVGDQRLLSSEVEQILVSVLQVANRTRAQIRRPLETFGRVTITVVDTNGTILGVVRNLDAPVFGSDVSVQKARTTMLMSSPEANEYFSSIKEPARYLDNDFTTVRESVMLDDYMDRSKALLGATAFEDGVAYSIRSVSNIHRPFFPDGLSSARSGPLNKEPQLNEWSIFSTGLQLDVSYNRILEHVLYAATGGGNDVPLACNESADPGRLANGLQIFASGVPVYRNGLLIGGLGVAGDAPEQDEMMAFLGLDDAGKQLATGIGNAPPELRADRLSPDGFRLRYVQCPQNPFVNSSEENVCEGL
ncbi:MAG: hypothetical protein ACO3Z6_06440 [Pseudomonadales bacterium]